MKYLLGCIFAIFLGIKLANASTITALCTDLKGQRVDYFTQNNIERNNFEFFEDKDSITKGQITLIWETTKKEATFIFPDTATLGGQPNTTLVHLLYVEPDQITFVGVLKGAPIMLSIYPKDKVAVYAMQSVWIPVVGQGVRANMFYAKCNFDMN